MKELCAEYTQVVERYHNPAADIGRRNNIEIARGHILYMLKNLPDLGDIGQQNRWIGFVQGWMWCNGIRDIDTLREDITKAMSRQEQL